MFPVKHFILYNIYMYKGETAIVGRLGEELVSKYLRRKGYLIISRNYNVEHIGEIDIIAVRDGVMHFVEVKSSSTTEICNHLHPKQNFDNAKKIRTIGVMQRYCYRNNIQLPRCVDLAAIYVSRETYKAEILYLENVYMDSI